MITETMIMNSKLRKVREKIEVAYFKTSLRHLPSEIKKLALYEDSDRDMHVIS
jgi:hypothetical protein